MSLLASKAKRRIQATNLITHQSVSTHHSVSLPDETFKEIAP
jgi:hypothetical protein